MAPGGRGWVCLQPVGGACSPGPKAWWAAPHPWEMGMQRSYGPIKDRVIELHNLVLVIITLITLFVGGLLIWVMVRYNARRNPVPSQTSHNTVLEIAWTVHSGADPGDHRDPVVPADILSGPDARSRHDHQGHRPSVVLGIRLSGSGQPGCREPLCSRRGSEAWPASSAGRGQSDGDPGREENPHPDHQLAT